MYKIITLCGSTKFKKQFEEEMARLTLEGNIIISVGVFPHADQVKLEKETKEMLDDVHKGKIDLSEQIHVINVDGYLGESTISEIKHAIETKKVITYLEEAEEGGLLLDKELLDKHKLGYEHYKLDYMVNKKDLGTLQNLSYVGGIFYLLNEFIKADSDDDEVVKNSKHYDQYTGYQVGFAKSVFKRLKKDYKS